MALNFKLTHPVKDRVVQSFQLKALRTPVQFRGRLDYSGKHH